MPYYFSPLPCLSFSVAQDFVSVGREKRIFFFFVLPRLVGLEKSLIVWCQARISPVDWSPVNPRLPEARNTPRAIGAVRIVSANSSTLPRSSLLSSPTLGSVQLERQ